jgi:hypothetical protein
VAKPVQSRTVQTVVLCAIVTAQTLLIGADAQRMADALSQAAQCFVQAEGWAGGLAWIPAGLYRWAAGLLPLALALALGGALAWTLRAFSVTPAHIAGLGQVVGPLSLLQDVVLAIWFWLLPPQPPSSDWHNDGLAYTVLVVLSAAAWMFCNPLLLWRCASGSPPRPDPEELRRLYRLAREHREALARQAAERTPPPGQTPR